MHLALPCLAALLGLADGADDPPRVERLTFDGRDKERPAWTPDGRTLLFARHDPEGPYGASIRQYALDDPGAAAAAAEPRRLFPARPDAPEYHAVASPDGHRLLLVAVRWSGTQGNLDVAAANRDGTGLEVVAGDPEGKLAHQDWPAWRPDGRRFAFSSTHEGNQEIYAADADGSNVARLTQSPGHDAHPCWTPDGSRVVFATDRWGGLELASMAADGTDLTRLTHSPGLDDYPAVAPDDGALAFVSNRDGHYEIYVARPDGADPVAVAPHSAQDTQPTWSPDGRTLTFLSDRDGGVDVYRAPRPAGALFSCIGAARGRSLGSDPGGGHVRPAPR